MGKPVMSFYLRTNIKVGPVRVNMSRSGLGASAGFPGFRVGAGPRGTYVSLVDGLASYHATVRPRHRSSPPQTPPAGPTASHPELISAGEVVLSDVSGATTLEMAKVSSSELVTQLNSAARSMPFWPWCLLLTVALMAVSPWTALAGAPLTVWIFWKDRIRRTVVAFYDVQGTESARFQQLVDSFEQARTAQRAWHVVAAGAVTTTQQHKVNAGASAVVERLPVSHSVGGPKHLSSNIAVPSLTTPRRAVYFLPDRVLIRDGRHYSDIAYRDLHSEAAPQRFIESGSVPADAIVLDHTWQYVNVKGGPDRRYKNNRQLPIVQYSRLTLADNAGYSAIFDFSAPAASSTINNALRTMATSRTTPPPTAPNTDDTRPQPTSMEAVDLDRFVEATQSDVPRKDGHAEPVLSRRRLSAQGRVTVVGESHYQPALHQAARGITAGTDFDQHLPVVAMLVPEPDNPHDSHAVRVDIATNEQSSTVGYLSRYLAPGYQRPLLALRRHGQVGTCPARITGGGHGRSYGIYLHLAGPDALLLHNLHDDADLLDPARQVTVTREEDHQEALVRYHDNARPWTPVAAELASSTVTRGKHAGAYAIEVRLNGTRVGELTAAMSTRYRNLVTKAEQNDGIPRCEATVSHGQRGYQIELQLPKLP